MSEHEEFIFSDRSGMGEAVKYIKSGLNSPNANGFLFAAKPGAVVAISMKQLQTFPVAAAKRIHAALGMAIAAAEKGEGK